MNYCFFTPSYIGDLDRVSLLRLSIQKFAKEQLKHYIVVPTQDYKAFRKRFLTDKMVTVLEQNAYINKLFYPTLLYKAINYIAPSQSWRLSKQSGRPGWIIQQIVKLSIPSIINEDAAFIVDSDVFFIRGFSIYEIVNDSSSNRFLFRLHPSKESALQKNHIIKSREILKTPEGLSDFHYMSCPALFYTDWVLGLQEHISKKNDLNWQETLFKANTISEYSLYGIYADEIAKFENKKIITTPLYHGIWSNQDFSKLLSHSIVYETNIICIVVQSNLGISVEYYKDKLQHFLESRSE